MSIQGGRGCTVGRAAVPDGCHGEGARRCQASIRGLGARGFRGRNSAVDAGVGGMNLP